MWFSGWSNGTCYYIQNGVTQLLGTARHQHLPPLPSHLQSLRRQDRNRLRGYACNDAAVMVKLGLRGKSEGESGGGGGGGEKERREVGTEGEHEE